MANTIKYSIHTNEQFNSTEVSFSEKPSANVLQALKTCHYRWNPTKKMWYGFCTKDEVKQILTHPETATAMAEKKDKERQAFWAQKKAEKEAKAKKVTKKTTAKAEIKAKETVKAKDKKVAEKVAEMSITDMYKSTKAPAKKAPAKGKSKK